MTGPKPFRRDGDDILLAVRVTPRARKDAIGGVVDAGDGRAALAVRLAAPPVEGAANQALIAFLARSLGISRSAVSLEAGDKSRLKQLRLRGVPQETLDRIL